MNREQRIARALRGIERHKIHRRKREEAAQLAAYARENPGFRLTPIRSGCRDAYRCGGLLGYATPEDRAVLQRLLDLQSAEFAEWMAQREAERKQQLVKITERQSSWWPW